MSEAEPHTAKPLSPDQLLRTNFLFQAMWRLRRRSLALGLTGKPAGGPCGERPWPPGADPASCRGFSRRRAIALQRARRISSSTAQRTSIRFGSYTWNMQGGLLP
jgi:hypothetical protein